MAKKIHQNRMAYQDYLDKREDGFVKLQADFVFVFTKVILSISSAGLGFLFLLLQNYDRFPKWDSLLFWYKLAAILFCFTVILLLIGLLFGAEAFAVQIKNDRIKGRKYSKTNYFGIFAEVVKWVVLVIFSIALVSLGMFLFGNIEE